MKDGNALFEVQNIGKSFGATRALDSVSVEFKAGELLAVVGANGAGKSTLIKIICGYHADYEGKILVEGKEVHFHTPKAAYENGIATVHQIINEGVVPSMTVFENLTLAKLLSPELPLFYDKDKLRDEARQIATTMGLEIDLEKTVSDLSQSERQMIAIARALANKPKLLILDEPTSSLSEREAGRLFAMLGRLKEMGVSILYVSHRLHEINQLADRVIVIRDGKMAKTLHRPFLVKDMVTAMVGEIPKHSALAERDRELKETNLQLELRELVVAEGIPPLNLKIRKGEILGLTGLIGAGKTELAQVLFGIKQPVSGEIRLSGKVVNPRTIYEAVRAGIFYVPEDRAENAVIPLFNIRQNMTLPFLGIFEKIGIVSTKAEKVKVKSMIKSMGIKCEGTESEISSLSGGNQQKVVVARWLLEKYNLVIFDEPFQGVDIRSRHDIGEYVRENIGDKAAIIIATDIDELIEIADRIVVMNKGVIVGEQEYEKINRDELLHLVAQETNENTYKESIK
ncbi:sugar ABC transporter ATP-binding protein [Alkalispirochaeta alkalica]|uniref:sugar ABC transporter ATP-binding protein n=1 Tax=Alkalispirochaeta alkalica TaxID=46356 RepID=UPI00038021CF|nr:sugar ABC transporter ATP-binding protein [Alkalispirochaeta alkalica]